MTLHTNHLRYIADRDGDGHLTDWHKDARSYLTDAANEIDKLRLEIALLSIKLTYAQKAQVDGS